jgi:hypothetical protein
MKSSRQISIYLKQIVLIILIFSNAHLTAQPAEEELASQFLGNKEFSKAADLYEKLLSKAPRSMYFYDNLIDCYVQLGNFETAQKLVKKQIKRFENNSFYKVDQGYLLKIQNQEKKASDLFFALIKGSNPLEKDIYELAKAFEKRNEKLFAIETYLNGRKVLKSEFVFANELGGLYSEVNEPQKMIEEFLLVLVLDGTYLDEVQGYFQNSLKNNQDYTFLKTALQRKIKQYPDNNSFPEMLIWLHVQKNEYDLALIYAKQIDKKYKEEGRRLIELGFLAVSNFKYEAGITIFKQVELLGKDKPYYSLAKNSELEARSKKILEGNYTKDDLLILEKEYENLLEEFGRNPSTATTLKSLANLEAYYLHNNLKAIDFYEEVINMQRINRNLQAECKLELGDYYIMNGDVWEAMLLYGQVDKDFLQEPLGQEAKLRNAKLSYYLGEFDWAKAQLDILKTATTQLIANNALELSLLIQDNTQDSLFEPLQLFAQADLLSIQNKDSMSFQKLDSIMLLYPKNTLIDDIFLKKAEIYEKRKDYINAEIYNKKIIEEYGNGILGDNALYNLAKIYQYKIKKPEEALKLYEKFIDTYSGSFFLTDCRKQFRILRGDLIN